MDGRIEIVNSLDFRNDSFCAAKKPKKKKCNEKKMRNQTLFANWTKNDCFEFYSPVDFIAYEYLLWEQVKT